MAWNTPGKGSGSPKNTGNPVEDLLNRIKDGFNGRGGSSGSGPLPIIIGLLVVLVLFNCFKLIDERQRGVVLRFGAFDRVMQPGANWKLPWPIETAYVVDATKVEELKDSVSVLTKDENIVEIEFNVQYQISNPRLYLFGFRDSVDANNQQGVETLRHSAESAVREVVGNNTMDKVLFERSQLAIEAQKHLQETLNLYKTGLTVSQFTLPNARPPEEVKQAFDDAISARENKNQLESEAKAYASKTVPEAKGVAARVKAESEGYKASVVAKAQGDAKRFSLLVEQYRKAPEVTRKRLYLETMQDVLSKNQKVVSGRDNNVFYLPLNGTGMPSPENAVTRMPAVQAVIGNDADNKVESSPRREGREGSR
ncbi:MAG TPA: FtsH protease activity modulator HflK [Arenimonas sp.]|jgi:membrane protease subunit HflK|nr:FtsH protease activity modulator HflK [Arenimonas sp.]HPW32633.1 FtsH protease activity modulator HflK [Arenimonas sp.]